MKPSLSFLFSLLLLQPLASQSNLTVSFRLEAAAEMPNIKVAGTVGLRGNTAPLSWDKTYPLSDPDKDGVFEGKVTFANATPGAIVEYKYIHDNTVWENTPNRVMLLKNAAGGRRSDRWNEASTISPSDFPPAPAAALQADFEIARKAYLTLHPGLERYKTRAEIETHFRQFEAVFQTDMDYRQAYRAFSKMTAGIQCGHTYANFYNQSSVLQQLVFEQPDKLPFCFRLIDKSLIVTHNLSGNENIVRGSEIIAINRVPVSQILDSLLTVVKADGDNDGKRLNDLELSGFGRFESFDIYFPLFFPPDANGEYLLDVQTPNDGARAEIPVASISRDKRKELLAAKYQLTEPTADALWTYKMLDDQTALLRLGTFVTWQMKMNWRDFLKKAFADIQAKNIRHLILDIRGNEGGNDEVIVELAKYLATKDLTLEKEKSLVRYTNLPPDLAPYLSSWDNTFKTFSAKPSATYPGYYELSGSEVPATLPKQKKAFSGRVYALVNAANSSATFYLAKILKDNQLATLIGQETGGSQRGLNGGQTAFLRLPNSGIELDIPLIGTFYDNKPATGIVPDVVVRPSVEYLAGGTDAELETALKMIREGK